MDNEHAESLTEKIKDFFSNAVGLPPGKFPDGETKPIDETIAPRGTLTSEDAERLPPRAGTGISVE